ncbi:MAG: T9SS C-terminal target domain-containing protein [Bacteroidetes bacterium]|nr:MAG: T9SS C-terminal target domain-containing protein [Bacteroidota bacterium]
MRKSLQSASFAVIFFFMAFQAVSQEVVSSAGNYHESETMSISWTLGETVTETFTAGELILTQGFQQPTLIVVSVDELADFDLTVTAFPNPTADILTVKLENHNYDKVSYTLYDMSGRLFTSGDFSGSEERISFTSLKSGVYFLTIMVEGKEARTLKILKQ